MIEFSPLPKNPTVAVLYLTFNRLYYTRETLPALLDSSDTSFSVRIVDNGSTDGTVEYLKKLNHPNIEKIFFNKRNKGLVKPTKRFWNESSADLVGKIDNDILVPKGWIDNLVDAHLKILNLGVCGYCHFREEDFNPDIVKEKVVSENGVFLRKQPWIGGNYLLKRGMVTKIKGYRQSRKLFQKRILYGFNKYQETLAKSGFIHGYLCNENNSLYTWDHIDDPRHPFFIKDEKYYKIRNMTKDDIIKWYKRDAQELLVNYK
ncbi:MAG: glycosyltransferase [Candidatus Marinimicrobia bacterium]|nr:glycosyltransferase [Candidatus Neomarinimicrobiota bacterium]